MSIIDRTTTRRQLLRTAGAGAAGLALTGAAGKIVSGALASHSPAPPRPPRWHSRPDLQIPALSVARSEAGGGHRSDLHRPLQRPDRQAGAVIVDNSGQPIWENPLAGKVTTNFRVQRYRGSPVLTWWEGSIELGHGVGEYVIADASYRTIRRVQAARRPARRPARVRDHATRHRAADELRRYRRRPLRGRRLAPGHDPGRDLPGDRSGQRRGPARVAQPRSRPAGDSYAAVDAGLGLLPHQLVDLDDDGNLLVSSRSTHTIYKVDRQRSDPLAPRRQAQRLQRWAPGATSPGSTTPAVSSTGR